jgi:hypothetical protein
MNFEIWQRTFIDEDRGIADFGLGIADCGISDGGLQIADCGFGTHSRFGNPQSEIRIPQLEIPQS